jgi:hypothetical protein
VWLNGFILTWVLLFMLLVIVASHINRVVAIHVLGDFGRF